MWLSLLTDPTSNWSQASWTRQEAQQVKKNSYRSNGQSKKRAEKSTVASETNEQDVCAPGSALYGRVA
jgi:hypothetical protein